MLLIMKAVNKPTYISHWSQTQLDVKRLLQRNRPKTQRIMVYMNKENLDLTVYSDNDLVTTNSIKTQPRFKHALCSNTEPKIALFNLEINST